MSKLNNSLNIVIGFCLIILQVSNCSSGLDLRSSMVEVCSAKGFQCAGTLVKVNFVVTSAECAGNDAAALIVKGNHLWDEESHSETPEASVADIFRPQDYDAKTGYMDVAVLKLERSLDGFDLRPAKLCSKNSIDFPPVGTHLTAYFWLFAGKLHYIGTSEIIASDKDTCSKIFNGFVPTLTCALDPENGFPGYSGPVAIDGEFCAIHSSKSNRGLIALTSLANPKVRKFVDEAVAY